MMKFKRGDKVMCNGNPEAKPQHTPTKRFTIVTSLNSPTGEWFRIHAASCGDASKEARMFGEGSSTVEAESGEKLAEDELKQMIDERGEESGFEDYHWKVLPCCKEVK